MTKRSLLVRKNIAEKYKDDYFQISRLVTMYCYYCDDNYDAKGIASLFSEDGVWDGGARGRKVGRESIFKYFSGSSQRISFAAHLVTNELIDVIGDAAEGRWRMIMPYMLASSETSGSRWLVGTYFNKFAKINGEWLIKSVSITTHELDPVSSKWVPG